MGSSSMTCTAEKHVTRKEEELTRRAQDEAGHGGQVTGTTANVEE